MREYLLAGALFIVTVTVAMAMTAEKEESPQQDPCEVEIGEEPKFDCEPRVGDYTYQTITVRVCDEVHHMRSYVDPCTGEIRSYYID